jgi:hypothetical protein
LKTHSLTPYPLMPLCHKAVSLALSFTSFTPLIYQPLRTPLQRPLLTILQSWPQTLIQPSPLTSCNCNSTLAHQMATKGQWL